MFKKTALVLVTLALLTGLASCSKYGDLKDSLDKMNQAVDTFISENGKVTDAASAAAAVSKYAQTIKDNTKNWGATFKQHADAIASPASDFPADLTASREKFVALSPQLAKGLESVSTNYGAEKAVRDAFGLLYSGLIGAISNSVNETTKFEADIAAAADAKAAATVVSSYSDNSRKHLEEFDNISHMYPELQYSPNKPQILLQPIADFGGINPKIVAAFVKIESFATDADVQKALEKRYARLTKGIGEMLVGSEKFVTESEKAKDAKTIASLIDAFADVNKATQKIVSTEVRLFPELQSKGIEGLPAGIRDPLKKIGEYNEKIGERVKETNATYIEPLSNVRILSSDSANGAMALKRLLEPNGSTSAEETEQTFKALQGHADAVTKGSAETLDLIGKRADVYPSGLAEQIKSVKDLNTQVTDALALSSPTNLEPLRKLSDVSTKLVEANTKIAQALDAKSDVQKAMDKLVGRR